MSTVADPTDFEMPAAFIFTDSAAAKVAELITEEGNPELKLRVFVQGGGCSGFSYGFTFDEIANDDDLQGAQFIIKNNPGATSTCGCGSSFSA
jgi:iron-sulfur cluster insertion protein